MNGSPPASRNGFSLVELLVVLFLMGLLAATVAIAMPSDEGKLRREAERFAARTVAARDEAITTGRPVLLVADEQGYRFEHLVDGAWQAWPDRRFAPVAWSGGTATSPSLRISFDPVGLASDERELRLVRGHASFTVHVARDGQVRLDAPR